MHYFLSLILFIIYSHDFGLGENFYQLRIAVFIVQAFQSVLWPAYFDFRDLQFSIRIIFWLTIPGRTFP